MLLQLELLEPMDLIMYMILAGVMLLTVVSLIRAHRQNGGSRYARFNLLDLFCTKDGMVSRPATMEMLAFLVMTWGFVTLTTRGHLTEWYAGIYIGAFVLRAAHSAHLRAHGKQMEDGDKSA
jgi:hypothetical protein